MRSLVLAACVAVLLAAQGASALYFHIKEGEEKCFIEEVADETLVIGALSLLSLFLSFVCFVALCPLRPQMLCALPISEEMIRVREGETRKEEKIKATRPRFPLSSSTPLSSAFYLSLSLSLSLPLSLSCGTPLATSSHTCAVRETKREQRRTEQKTETH